MSKLETNTIDTVSGTTNLTIGGANNTGSTTIKSNNTAAITVDSSQRIGIGTTSPSAELHLSATAPIIKTTATNNSSGLRLNIVGGGNELLRIQDDGSEAMRINSNREVAIGTTSPKGGAALTCSDASGDHDIALDLITTTSSADVLRIFANEGGSGGTAIYILPVRTAGTLRGGIYWNGSSLAYNTSSDYRLKENIADITDATTRVKQLQPKRFNFITDADRTVDGFIAHEVSSVVPEAITGEKDAMKTEEYEVTPAVLDEDGNVITEAVMGTREVPEYQGIDQAKLVPVLTKALQEAITKIEELETRIQILETP